MPAGTTLAGADAAAAVLGSAVLHASNGAIGVMRSMTASEAQQAENNEMRQQMRVHGSRAKQQCCTNAP